MKAKTKTKAELAYAEVLKRLIPELAELNEAAHAVLTEKDDKEWQDIDRVFALGEITDNASFLCPAAARILADISLELMKTPAEHDGEVETNVVPITSTEH